MRIYRRTSFLLGLVCMLPIIYEWRHFADVRSVIWIGFFLYMGIRLLCMSMLPATEKQNENDES